MDWSALGAGQAEDSDPKKGELRLLVIALWSGSPGRSLQAGQVQQYRYEAVGSGVCLRG